MLGRYNTCFFVFLVTILSTISLGASAQSKSDFRSYIIKAVSVVSQSREKGGYDITAYFTSELQYGKQCCIKSNKPTLTMCVAAVAEIIIEAINIYSREKKTESAYKKLPIKMWQSSSRGSLRPYIFMYAGTKSTGTGYALEKFGIGKMVDFTQLKRGDFINFSRVNGSGHAGVFLGFLNSDYTVTDAYGSGTVGFKYYSAQGKGKPDAGFANRWAFFDGQCPAAKGGMQRDCGVIKGNYLFGGTMFHPDDWPSAEQVSANLLNEELKSILETNYGSIEINDLDDATKAIVSAFAESQLSIDLEPVSTENFDGATTD